MSDKIEYLVVERKFNGGDYYRFYIRQDRLIKLNPDREDDVSFYDLILHSDVVILNREIIVKMRYDMLDLLNSSFM